MCMSMYVMCSHCEKLCKTICWADFDAVWIAATGPVLSCIFLFGTNENVKHPNPCTHSAMVHAHWRWCRKNLVKAGAVCFHILSWVWRMTDTEHTRDARDVRDTRNPNMHCCVYTFWADFPSTALWQQLWQLVRESNGYGADDCKEMWWAVQGCAGFVPRRCLWASARFTVRTLFHCDL